MEKKHLAGIRSIPKKQDLWIDTRRFWHASLLVILMISALCVPPLSGLFRCDYWRQVRGGIAWSACPDVTEFQCAFLEVPMNYLNPLPNETVSLALRRLPATAPLADRLGTLLVNPGGPGGSGTEYIVDTGKDLDLILKGRYDILSWDPRGVNMSTPPMDCFPTDYDERVQEFKLYQTGWPFEMRAIFGTDVPWFKTADRYYQALVDSCAQNGNQKMLKSLSTAFTARDMVEILKALGEEERGLQYWGFEGSFCPTRYLTHSPYYT